MTLQTRITEYLALAEKLPDGKWEHAGDFPDNPLDANRIYGPDGHSVAETIGDSAEAQDRAAFIAASRSAPDIIRELVGEVERLERDSRRYKWLANRVLACDYGDNDAPDQQIGWRIRHDIRGDETTRAPAFMYGASIDNAVDSELEKANG